MITKKELEGFLDKEFEGYVLDLMNTITEVGGNADMVIAIKGLMNDAYLAGFSRAIGYLGDKYE